MSSDIEVCWLIQNSGQRLQKKSGPKAALSEDTRASSTANAQGTHSGVRQSLGPYVRAAGDFSRVRPAPSRNSKRVGRVTKLGQSSSAAMPRILGVFHVSHEKKPLSRRQTKKSVRLQNPNQSLSPRRTHGTSSSAPQVMKSPPKHRKAKPSGKES